MKKLSAYTIAKNCTDEADLECGRKELNQYIQQCYDSNKRVASFVYVRLKKICDKLFVLSIKKN